MTPLDTSVPNDSTLFSQLDNYQRETREYINNIESVLGGQQFSVTEVVFSGGELEVGEDLENINMEVVKLTGNGAQTLSTIKNGYAGQMKTIVAQDDNVTLDFTDSSIGGTFYMDDNADISLSTKDTVAFVNVGGDGGTTSHGYWQELYRAGSASGSSTTFSVTALTFTGGLLTVGSELENTSMEIVELTGDGAQTLSSIESGRAGQIKQIMAQDDNITLAQDKSSTTGGSFSLNSPSGEDLQLNTSDVIVLVNVDGDGGTTSHGYWQEMYRTLAV